MIDEYDTIYLGYPNWWSTMPTIVMTFLESYDFTNKHIYPICSHEGSGMGRSESDLKKLCPNSIVHKGLSIHGSHVDGCRQQLERGLEENKMTDNAKITMKNVSRVCFRFLRTDPEFIEAFDNFAFDEVVNQDDLNDKTRFISILAVLLGCQGIDEFKGMLKAAYNFGVTPVEMKEIVYQAVAYLGIGRVFLS